MPNPRPPASKIVFLPYTFDVYIAPNIDANKTAQKIIGT